MKRNANYSKNTHNSKSAEYLLAALIVFCAASFASAATGGDYVLEWSTIDGGGGTSIGGQYELSGTIGQPDAGEMAGGDYELSGGFWAGPFGCFVDFEHFANFAEYWLDSGIDLPADLYVDDTIDLLDLKVFAEYWLCLCPLDWPLR